MTVIKQQVLVTGATGFLGGALALRLAAEGTPVRALARSPQKAGFLCERGIEVFPGDVTDAEAMRQAAAGCPIVFHVAAAMGGSYAKQQAINVGGTRNLLQAAVEAGTERFVHVSSISIYGFKYSGEITEETPPAPSEDPYSRTKAEGEKVAQGSNIAYTIIRPGMIYGAGAVNWTEGLFKLARINPTPFVGSGSGSTFPIHRDDVVDLLIAAATHPAAARQIFNCTPDPSPTWRELMGGYARLAGHNRWLALPPALFSLVAEIGKLTSPPHTARRDLPDQVRFLQRQITYKMTKARELLGWTPRIDLEAGIASCAPALRERGLLP